MPRPCCQKPLAKIIRVGTFEAGIIGFDAIMRKLAGSKWTDEQELANRLLSEVREYGNYISPAVEGLYRMALLREFRIFVSNGAKEK